MAKITQYLLDTNIIVHFLRGKYKDCIEAQFRQIGLKNMHISEITVAELQYGQEYKRLRGDKLDSNLDDFLSNFNILPITKAIRTYAKEKARLRYNGTPQDDDFDLLIGSTSVVNNLVLVTENVRHFQNINGIRIENWIER